MHDTAMKYGEIFFTAYASKIKKLAILDIGSQDVNGSLRSLAPVNSEYIGIDFVKAKGVDIVITDPYSFPFKDESQDIVVSSSCFEHSEFFWLLFNEMLRVLKPSGLLYINAPSNGFFHRYPLDYWRFYPDSGIALERWGKRNGYKCALLESFIGAKGNSGFNDFVAVFIKDEKNTPLYKHRIQDALKEFTNGHLYNSENVINHRIMTEDQIVIAGLIASINSFKNSANK